MRKYLRIINLDGTEGSGKSTQIHLLCAFFTKHKIPFIVNYLEDNIESGIETSKKTDEFLSKEEFGVVINDGSPARMMVKELVSGETSKNILEKYKNLLSANERLFHKYGVANLLFIMEDLEEASNRINKRSKLIKSDYVGLDTIKEKEIVIGMKFFDIHPISKGLKFDIIEVLASDSMIDVSEAVFSYIDDNFEIKKPLEGL
jgi:hypothetical protein